MSSFLCEDKTINRVVSLFLYDKIGKRNHDKMKRVAKVNLKIEGSDAEYEAQVNMLGIQLRDLNIKALNRRYDDDEAELNAQNPYEGFDWKAEKPSRIQMLKSLACFTYQCNERDIDKTKLFKALSKVELELAYDIATDTDEYDKAVWG